MQELWDSIVNFFKRLFGGESAESGGVGGGQQAPGDTTSIAYFFYKVATTQSVYTNFAGAPVATVQNDPNLSSTNKATLVNALTQGGYGGYQAVYNAMVSEANSSSAIVWICIWIVVPPHHP